MQELPDNALSLARVHGILQRMSLAGPDVPEPRKRPPQKAHDDDAEDETHLDTKALHQSDQIREAMRTTAALWTKVDGEWSGASLDTRCLSIDAIPHSSGKQKKKVLARDKPNAKAHQLRAYVKWTQSRVDDWWAKLREGSQQPTAEQVAFLERVVERCRVERAELLQPEPRARFTEPVRDCLFGLPGAGKSTCIKWLRDFFETALGWEHGVQFQFLAAQNTMAALIGGNTVHSWGTIPVNAAAASQKSGGKDGGDVDEHFLNALGIRWLALDETSCVAAELLGFLDVYLRRACARHPYAKRNDGSRKRPFGGINMIFAGDLWQLPPVRATAIFSNPCVQGYSLEVQRIFKMFWQEGEDAIQRTFQLTQSMRTGDPWLIAVLDADRNGEESWEMYCFTHGLPTRNCGSWMPQSEGPSCGQAKCAKLAEEIWPAMQKLSWRKRQSEECEVCTQERRRRHCIVVSDETRHREVVAPVADIAAMPPPDPKQKTGSSVSDEVGGASRAPEAESSSLREQSVSEGAQQKVASGPIKRSRSTIPQRARVSDGDEFDISDISSINRHKKPPFVDAPFVHPFRHPSYHAQQLRAITFAQARQQRLLWITAHDVPMMKDPKRTSEQAESRKERWLEFHDRFTSGIPGLFPLVLDLPVRFTDATSAVARTQGVFKNARGWLRGWDLAEEEQQRLADMQEPEIVMKKRPRCLYIEMEAPTKELPLTNGKAIFRLAVQARVWSLDPAGKVRILRYGFNIVPDFGGTAHAYCGSTLEACIGDLLPWHQKPRREDALKAYIIKSRVRQTDRLLLAQPYSPHLFRQGVHPGLDLLLKVLMKDITWEEVRSAPSPRAKFTPTPC